MQIVFGKLQVNGAAGVEPVLVFTKKAAGGDRGIIVDGIVGRPNSLKPPRGKPTGKPGSGGTREFSGGRQGGGGKILGLNMNVGGGERVGDTSLMRNAKGQWASYSGAQSLEERVAGLERGDADAARSLSMGGAIDKATMDRLGALGLLTLTADGKRYTVSPESRRAMANTRQTAAQQAEIYKKGKQEEAEKAAEEKSKKKQAEAEAKAAAKAAERKVEADKAKAAAKVEREAAVAKAAADKEQQKIKLVREAEEAQKKQQAAQRVTLEETAVAAGVDKSSVAGLLDFVNGADVEYGSPLATKLEEKGLISLVAGTRQYQIGPVASAFLNAAMQGNKRGAKDILLSYGAQKRAAAAQAAAAAEALVPKVNTIGGGPNVRTVLAGSGPKPLPFSPNLFKTKELGGSGYRTPWLVFGRPELAKGAFEMGQRAINIIFGKS